MTFGTHKTPTEVIKEEAFGRTYFRDFILVLMVNGTHNQGKNSMS